MDTIDKGFYPDSNINDQAPGLIKAFENQLENTELHYDHFGMVQKQGVLLNSWRVEAYQKMA